MAAKTRDMTVGSPAKLALSFALPLMLGNVCQQFYTITDAAIVGQFAGLDALSALGSADWMVWMVFGVISSVMHGFGIPMAQAFGAGDRAGLKRLVYTAGFVSLAISLSYTALGLIAIDPLLTLLGTLDSLFNKAAAYLYIMVSGAVLTTGYNLLSSILRALGNSRAPLIAMVASSAANIALDLLFVWAFQWGVVGAAAATLISQAAACGVCLAYALKINELRGNDVALRLYRPEAGKLLRLSLPMALQSAMIGVGGMALQKVINGLGKEFVAGFTATNKLYGIMEAAAVAFGMAVVTYVGQNLGAKKVGRIRDGMKRFVPLGILMSGVMTLVLFLFGETFLRLFIEKGAPASTTRVALRYLKTMAATLGVLYLLYVYRSALLGIGNTFIPMISGFAECFVRVGVAVTLTALAGKSGIYWAETSAWSAAMLILLVSWYVKQRGLEGEAPKPNKVK